MMFPLLLVSMSRSSKGHFSPLCSQSECKVDNLQRSGARNGLAAILIKQEFDYRSQPKLRRLLRCEGHILFTSSPPRPQPIQQHES